MSEARKRAVAYTAGGLALLLGLYLRFLLVAGEDFPLNDGGLFYLMTQELRAAGYMLPVFTSYNSAGIPFAYPPLAFYLAGFVSDLSRVPLLDVVRLMPAVLSTFTIGAFYLLSSAVLKSRSRAAIATLAFALLPRAFMWFVMGGGLTRAPGLLFALLMLQQTFLLYTRGDRRLVASVSALGAATLLTHAENGWFAGYSAALFFLVYGRNRRALIDSLLVVLGVLTLTAPWWGTVISRHGFSPFTAVAQSGGYSALFNWQPIVTFTFTDEPYLGVLALLGLLGIFASLAERKFFLPIWLATVFAINPRNGATSAMVPLAMLVAVAVDCLLIKGLLRSGAITTCAGSGSRNQERETGAASLAHGGGSGIWQASVLGLLLTFLIAYAFLNARAGALSVQGLRVLSVEARGAMQWVAKNTDPRSRFIVMDGRAPWFGLDVYSEWFPALAQRASVATVQGYEWLPDQVFYRRMERYAALGECRHGGIDCLERWAAQGGQEFSHVFLVHDGCCEPLRNAARALNAGYTILFEGRDLLILQRR